MATEQQEPAHFKISTRTYKSGNGLLVVHFNYCQEDLPARPKDKDHLYFGCKLGSLNCEAVLSVPISSSQTLSRVNPEEMIDYSLFAAGAVAAMATGYWLLKPST